MAEPVMPEAEGRPRPRAAGGAAGRVLAEALRLLVRHRRAAYAASTATALVITVPDVLRQVAVWDDPRYPAALVVDVLGVLTAVLAQLWLTGALVDVPRVRAAGALRRGTAVALRAVRRAPRAVLAGVVAGGAVSALVTVPPSVAALGVDGMVGPLHAPSVAAFAVAAVSDVVATILTLPFLSLVLVVAAHRLGDDGT